MRFSSFTTATSIGFDTLRANPLRTVLSTLGVIIGVASLVAVLSVGDGMEAAVRSQIEQTTDLQTISVQSKVAEEVDGQLFPVRNPMRFTPADVPEASALAGASSAALLLRGRGEVRSQDGDVRRMAVVLAGVSEPDTVGVVPVESGRMLSATEAAGDSALVVLAHDLARALSPDSNAKGMVGQSVTLEGQRAAVIGVLPPLANPPAPPGPAPVGRPRGDARVIAPLGFTLAALPEASRSAPVLAIHAGKVEETAALKSHVESWLAARDTGWARRATIATAELRLQQASTGILMFKLFMGAITGISLLVGGIGIMNVLLSSVTERTREIGIRKATGALEGDIRLQFLAESVAISSAGSTIGLVLGVSGAFGITAIIRRVAGTPFLQASFSLSTFLVAVFAAVFVGLVFGTYPARRAARLSPIDAIRHE